MKFSWQNYPRPIIGLAPMAGYTDTVFRRLVKELAPSAITISELTSADALAYNSKKTLELLKFNQTERPYIAQLFGKNPENFAKAVKIVEEVIQPDGIDINMGCPAKKVVSSGHGVALMRNPKLACEIVQACVENTKLPVSVKTRLGWNDPDAILDFGPRIARAGASALMIHGRTYAQAFGGISDWTNIYKLKDLVQIPVLGNGDIKSLTDFENQIGNLDGVLIGRATFGNPWLLGTLTGECTEPQSLREKLPTIFRQAELADELLGRKGMLELRKHLACYVKGIEGAGELRAKLVTVDSPAEVKQIFTEYFQNQE